MQRNDEDYFTIEEIEELRDELSMEIEKEHAEAVEELKELMRADYQKQIDKMRSEVDALALAVDEVSDRIPYTL